MRGNARLREGKVCGNEGLRSEGNEGKLGAIGEVRVN